MMGPTGSPAQSAAQSLFDLAALLTDKDELAARIKALNEAESSALAAKEAADARLMEAVEVERRVSDREMAVSKREQKAEANEAELTRRELAFCVAKKDHDTEHADRMGRLRGEQEEMAKTAAMVAERERKVAEAEKAAADHVVSAKESKVEWERKVSLLNAAMRG